MLACDLILEVRASRCLNRDQVLRLERMVFGHGAPNRDQLEMLLLIDSYGLRTDPSWAQLLARVECALLEPGSAPVLPPKAA